MEKEPRPLTPTSGDLEMSLSEDDLIAGLRDSIGKQVEVLAFGIIYIGELTDVNVRGGFIVVVDGDARATLEFERVESYRILE